MGQLTAMKIKTLTEPGRYRRTDFLEKRRSLMREWAAFCTSLVPSSG